MLWFVWLLGKKMLLLLWFLKPLDVMKMHGPLLELQLYTNFSICVRLTSLHMKPVHLYLALLEHCLCLDFVSICSHTLFLSSSMWPNLCSGFRLRKMDEFTGVSLILLCQAKLLIEGRLLYLQKTHGGKSPVYVTSPFLSIEYTIIHSFPRIFHFFHLSQDTTGSDGPCSCLLKVSMP